MFLTWGLTFLYTCMFSQVFFFFFNEACITFFTLLGNCQRFLFIYLFINYWNGERVAREFFFFFLHSWSERKREWNTWKKGWTPQQQTKKAITIQKIHTNSRKLVKRWPSPIKGLHKAVKTSNHKTHAGAWSSQDPSTPSESQRTW